MSSKLPPPQLVPTTPAIHTPDINALYNIFDNEEKGKGAFSRVVVAEDRNTKKIVAIKIMEKSLLTGKKAEMVAHEKEILRRTRHENIISLHKCIQTQDKVYMVMDLMKGDLFEYIVRHKKLPEDIAALVTYQLLDAIRYLHENSVVHRDVKPENILINGPEDVKLADFGLAKVVQEWDVKSTPCGTSFYIAPEIIRGIESNGARPLCTNREDVKNVDIWSCGVVMFILLAGRPPFVGQVKTKAERVELLRRIDRGLLFPDAQWANISPEAKDLVTQLLTQDKKHRIPAELAVAHDWFRKFPAVVAMINRKEEKRKREQQRHQAKEEEKIEEAAGAPEENRPKPGEKDAHAAPADIEERKKMAAEMNEIHQELVEEGDPEGDETSYTVESKPAAEEKKMEMSSKPAFQRSGRK